MFQPVEVSGRFQVAKGRFRAGWVQQSGWANRVATVAGAKFSLPAHAIWLHWSFADAEDLHSLEFDITIHNDPGTEIGLYFAPFNGYIGGQLTYGGLQTNVQHPSGRASGKGAIFSTWWTFDAADARTVGP